MIRCAVLFAITSMFLLGTTGPSELTKAAKKAQNAGVDSAFLAEVMLAKDAEFMEKSVKINVTNYAYTPDYSGHYNKTSVRTVKAFLKENDTLLTAVEKKYKVDKEVVASILWIESRCGKITGKYHVPSVYLSLVLADEDEYVQQSLDKVVADNTYNEEQTDSVRKLIESRAKRKSNWAIKELKALQEIHQRGVMDVTTLHGSWAGAFGFPQFLPSSYNKLAVDGNADGKIDLYLLDDAAHSIANYLSENGWSTTTSKQRKAVHSYNNSEAYVDAVLTLAQKIR